MQLRTLKPDSMHLWFSVPAKVTTELALFPSMMVLATTGELTGSVLVRTMFLPLNWMFSAYVP